MDSHTLVDPRDEMSLVGNDLALRLQQRVGLIPRRGLGVARRALFWTALAWLPIVVWAWTVGRVLPAPGQAAEPLLQHFGVHARLLVGIPLLILAEAVAHAVLSRLIPQFVRAGIVPSAQVPRFRAILADTARMRDSTLPWIIIIALAFIWAYAGTVLQRSHELSSAVEGGPTSLGFGGWLVRLCRAAVLPRAAARLAVARVVARDRAGAYREARSRHRADPPRPRRRARLPRAPSAGVQPRRPGPRTRHRRRLGARRGVPRPGRAHALPDDGGRPDPVAGDLPRAGVALSADSRPREEAGAARLWRTGGATRCRGSQQVDSRQAGDRRPTFVGAGDRSGRYTVALYEAVTRMRPVPLGKTSLLAIAVPVLIAFIAVLALQIPLKELLGQLLKGLL